jgi:hypothetical protein
MGWSTGPFSAVGHKLGPRSALMNSPIGVSASPCVKPRTFSHSSDMALMVRRQQVRYQERGGPHQTNTGRSGGPPGFGAIGDQAPRYARMFTTTEGWSNWIFISAMRFALDSNS